MQHKQPRQHYEIGMVGLGVMGRNLLLNMADHGFAVAGYDQDPAKVETLHQQSTGQDVRGTVAIAEFIDWLRLPRSVIMLVPAGAAVDAVIADLLEYLEPGDLIIDAGNSYFKDTDERSRRLEAQGIHLLGVGVSGGEKGARSGPSIMPGGPEAAYERVRHLFEAAAARIDGDPCVTYLGLGSAGHFVKMVHNGIEYGVMQLIAETYDLMKRGLGLNNAAMQEIYTSWNQGELNSYLVEITGDILAQPDTQTGGELIDSIRDVARQKGTGQWTSQSALELQVPLPTIDMAVAMRDLSRFTEEREQVSSLYPPPGSSPGGDRDSFLARLRGALYAAIIITYTQGMALLAVASERYEYHLDLEAVARIWRSGCIIRAALLEDIQAAYKTGGNLSNLLLAPNLARLVIAQQQSLRQVVCQAAEWGVPAPGLMTSLSYLDAMRSARLPTSLIQAQRDYFGAHTYERLDTDGTFHTEWERA